MFSASQHADVKPLCCAFSERRVGAQTIAVEARLRMWSCGRTVDDVSEPMVKAPVMGAKDTCRILQLLWLRINGDTMLRFDCTMAWLRGWLITTKLAAAIDASNIAVPGSRILPDTCVEGHEE